MTRPLRFTRSRDSSRAARSLGETMQRRKEETMPTATLRNWSMRSNDDGFTPPECRRYRLAGNVYGHPGRAEGEKICTSELLEIDWERRVGKTVSREYRLEGPADPQWVAWVAEHTPHLLVRIVGGEPKTP